MTTPKAGPLCPRLDDYPVFFATSEIGGKNNSGEYVHLKDSDGEDLLDLFGHLIVDQDLFDVREVLKQQYEKLKERDRKNAARLESHEQRYAELLNHIPHRPTIAESFAEFAKRHDFPFWKEEE